MRRIWAGLLFLLLIAFQSKIFGADYCSRSRSNAMYRDLFFKIIFYPIHSAFEYPKHFQVAKNREVSPWIYLTKKELPWLSANVVLFFLGGHISNSLDNSSNEEEWEKIVARMKNGENVALIITADNQKYPGKVEELELKMQILKNQYPQGNYTVIMNDKDPEGWVQETIAFSKKVDGIDELAFTGHGNTYTKFFNAIDTWEEKVNSLTLMNNDGHIYIGGCNDASGEFRQTNLRIVHRNHFGLQGVEGSVTAARGLNFGLDFRYSFVMEIFRIISPGGGFLFCASFESHEQYRLTETIEDGSKNLLELFIQGDQYTYPPKE